MQAHLRFFHLLFIVCPLFVIVYSLLVIVCLSFAGSLYNNFQAPIHFPLLSQFLPVQYTRVQGGLLENKFDELNVKKSPPTIDKAKPIES